jgi:uncharacterized membrane protein YebE (DUF533 family)
MKGMLGMGALGVAIAAFEHFTKQQKAGGTSFPGGPSPAPPGWMPPPPPPPPPGSTARPGAAPSLPPVPPPPPPASTTARQEEALLMVRAMIAAANADHELDADERDRIVKTLDESGVSGDEKDLLLGELERPMDMAALVAKATTPALRRDVYLASEMAINADSRAEQNYLARLARQLGLDDAQVAELRKVIGSGDGAESAG